MAFKRRRRANNTISAKILLPAKGSIPANIAVLIVQTCSETECIYGNMVERELLCVRVATLLRNKYASILRVISYGSTCQNFHVFFYSIVLGIYLALTTAQQPKIHRHCSCHNLGKDKLQC